MTSPIVIDTTGLVLLTEGRWRDQATGDDTFVSVDDTPLSEPHWLEDLAAARRSLARDHGKAGCLIEAEAVSLGGVPAMLQLVKFPHPDQPNQEIPLGYVYMASIWVAKTTCTGKVLYFADESGGFTGARESVVMVRLGMPKDFTQPHPYAPDVQSKLPYVRADDRAWDSLLPQHPLSRARAWVRKVTRTTVVDPVFAALPTFQPGSRRG
jgi:hypothetical protein